MQVKVTVCYFSHLASERGLLEEEVVTQVSTPAQLYTTLSRQYGLSPSLESLSLIINNRHAEWTHCLQDGDEIVFIPPALSKWSEPEMRCAGHLHAEPS